MGFLIFIVYLIVAVARPAEQFPALQAIPLMNVVAGTALVAAALTLAMGHRANLRAPQLWMVVVFLLWTALTAALSPLRSIGGFEEVLGLLKSSGTAFLLTLLMVTNPRRLHIVAVVLAISGVFLSTQAVSEHKRVEAETAAMSQGGEMQPQGDSWETAPHRKTAPGRIYISGLFGDPNDLALTLIATLPFCLALRRPSSPLRNALLVWVPFVIITYGIYVTRSRGGVLALACVLGLSVRHKIGKTLSLAAAGGAVSGLLALGFVGGRVMEIDRSAEGRIYAWAAGLQMLKYSPIWGVGFSFFEANHGRAAHSAFVECFAELGMVGYLLWLGLILVTLDNMNAAQAWATRSEASDPSAVELHRWSRAVFDSLAGFLVGAAFLSRTYDVFLFVLFGLGAAIGEQARSRLEMVHGRSLLTWLYVLSFSAVASIIGIWLYMRLGR
jgi:hypothetical protein